MTFAQPNTPGDMYTVYVHSSHPKMLVPTGKMFKFGNRWNSISHNITIEWMNTDTQLWNET